MSDHVSLALDPDFPTFRKLEVVDEVGEAGCRELDTSDHTCRHHPAGKIYSISPDIVQYLKGSVLVLVIQLQNNKHGYIDSSLDPG